MDTITISKRVTTSFLQAIPLHVEEFDAFMYLMIPRKKCKIQQCQFGDCVIIDPARLCLSRGIIYIDIPFGSVEEPLNCGISSIDDMIDDWFEYVQACFLSLIYSIC